MGIETLIPIGAEHAISRQRLCVLTGDNDRRNRELIEKARRDGHIIINSQDGNGYYRINTDSIAENELNAISRQYWQGQRRAKSILSYQKYLRKILIAHNMKV